MKKMLAFLSLIFLGGLLARGANFPTSVSTDSNLYVAVNNCYTSLTASVNASVTTLNVITTANFPAVGFVIVDNEVIKYAAKTSTSFTGCTRGSDGTTAALHVSGKVVYLSIIAAHHNVLKDEIIGIESYFLTGANEVHIDTTNARVGISTGTPQAKLDVAGSVNVLYGVGAATGVFSDALSAATLDTGQGANELYDMNQNVQTSDAVTFSSVDTGQGANELYDMDQNVLTISTPTFGGLTLSSPLPVASGGTAQASLTTVYVGSASYALTSVNQSGGSVSATTGQFSSTVNGTTFTATARDSWPIYADNAWNGPTYGATGYGIRGTDGQLSLWDRGQESLRINAAGQLQSVTDGTPCLPAWTFSTDAGSGLYMPSSDNIGMSVGCSTSVIFHQSDYPLPADRVLASKFTIYGGSSTAAGLNTKTDVAIFTSTMTTTDNYVMQVNQVSAFIIISGRASDYSAAYTDILLSSYYLPAPTVVASHNDLGSPGARTYTSGGSSTGIILCRIASGVYYTQAFSIQLNGK